MAYCFLAVLLVAAFVRAAGIEATPTPAASVAAPAVEPAAPTATATSISTVSPTPSKTATPSGPTPTLTPTSTRTPALARSGIALLPTAYSNRYDRSGGLNLDVLFCYYIGSIFEKQTGQSVEYLNPLRNWLFTGDVKYGFLEEYGNRPALAVGYLNTFLLKGSNPASSGTSSGGLKFTTHSLGGMYLAASKRISPGSSVHLGYIRGNIRDLFKSAGFMRRAMPNGNHSDLLPLFALGLEDVRDESSPNLFFTGWDVRLLGTTWRFELQKPFPLSKDPWLLNTKIDRLFSFNLAYERWKGGYAVLGYFNFRFTIIPPAPKGKSKK